MILGSYAGEWKELRRRRRNWREALSSRRPESSSAGTKMRKKDLLEGRDGIGRKIKVE